MGMSPLFQTTTPVGETVDIHVIPVSRYDPSDNSFEKIEYYPRVLTDKWVRVFIPKDQVVSVVVLESSEDLAKIGYQV